MTTTGMLVATILWCGRFQASSLSLRPSLLFSSTLNRINGDVSLNGDANINGDTSSSTAFTSPLSSETFTCQSAEATTTLIVSPQELEEEASLIDFWPGEAGATALRQVQFLASSASESTDAMNESKYSLATRRRKRMQVENTAASRSVTDYFQAKPSQRQERRRRQRNSEDPFGEGGGVFNSADFNSLAKDAKVSKLKRSDLQVSFTDEREEQVWTALANLELDSTLQNERMKELLFTKERLLCFALFASLP